MAQPSKVGWNLDDPIEREAHKILFGDEGEGAPPEITPPPKIGGVATPEISPPPAPPKVEAPAPTPRPSIGSLSPTFQAIRSIGSLIVPDKEPDEALAERRAKLESEAREVERQPIPPQAAPVTLYDKPGFTLPDSKRVYARSPEEARDLADVRESPPAQLAALVPERLKQEEATRQAWAKVAESQSTQQNEEIMAQLSGMKSVAPGKDGEEPEAWQPGFTEKVRKGTIATFEAPLSMAVATAKALPGLIAEDPATYAVVKQVAKDTGRDLATFGGALAEDPIGVMEKILDEDPVMFAQLIAVPLSGGGSALSVLGKLAQKSPRLARTAETMIQASKGMKWAAGQGASAPWKLALTATGLPIPGSHTYGGAKLIAGSDIFPPSLRSAARRVVLRPSEAINTLAPPVRAAVQPSLLPGLESRVAAEQALRKLYEIGEEVKPPTVAGKVAKAITPGQRMGERLVQHPISGEKVPTRQLFTEILHAQPKHWRDQLVAEGTGTRWVDPQTPGKVYGGDVPLPDDVDALNRLSLAPGQDPLEGGEFIRKRLLAQQFAGKDAAALPATLEDYGVTIQWRNPSGKVFKAKDLPPDAEILKGMKAEYLPYVPEKPTIRPPERPFALSFQEKQAQTGIPLRPAPEVQMPPGTGVGVRDIAQREIEFPLPAKGPQSKPGQTIGGPPATVQEGVDFSGRAPFSRPVEWDKLPPDIVGTERVDYPWVPPSGFSGAEKTAARMGLGPLPKPTIAAPQIVYEVLKDQRAAPTRAFDVTADQFVARFQGRPELAQMHPYNRAVALRDAHREIVAKLREANHPIAPQVLAEYPNVAATGESGIQLASEFTPPPERATGELRMGPVEITPPPPGPRGFEPGERRGPAANIPEPPPTPFRFDIGAAPEAPKVVPPVGPVGVLGKPGAIEVPTAEGRAGVAGAPEIPFLRHGEYPGKPRGLPSGEIQGELPLSRPPKGGFPVPAKPVVLAPEGSPPLAVTEGPKGRMVARAMPAPPPLKTPKPPQMSDDAWRLVNEVVAPIRNIVDNLGARAAAVGAVEGEDVVRRFGSYLSRAYDWEKLVAKNPELALKMNAVKDALGANTPLEAAASKYGEFLRLANEGQDMTARRVIGDLPMQTLRDAYELMADGPSVVRDTTFRLGNAVARGETLKGLSEIRGATIGAKDTLPSGWKHIPLDKTPGGKPKYGALAGKGVSPEVWDALRLLDDMHEGSTAALGAWGKTVKGWKQLHVLWPYNLGALPRNFLNAAFNQAMMGKMSMWDPANSRTYIKLGQQLIGKGGPELDEARAAMSASGGKSLLEDARLRSAVHEVTDGLTWEKVRLAVKDPVTNDVDWLKTAKKWGIDEPGKLYAAVDEYFKAVTYTIVRDMQKGYASGDKGLRNRILKRAQSIWGDEAEARLLGGPAAAVRHAYESFLDYADAPGWVRAASSTGVAPYYKYTALTAPQIANYFARRPIHSLLMRELGDASERFLSYAAGFTPEEVEQAKDVSPAYRGSQVFVGRDKIGRPQFIQSQYITSPGAVLSPQREFKDTSFLAAQEVAFGGPVAQLYDTVRGASATPTPSWFTGYPIAPPSAPESVKWSRSLDRGLQTILPPALAFTLPQVMAAAKGEVAPWSGVQQSVGQVLQGALSGTKLLSVDAPRRQATIASQARRNIGELEGEINRILSHGTAKEKQDLPALVEHLERLSQEAAERIGVPK